MKESNVDILVIGASTTGLLAAVCALAHGQKEVRVVEKKEAGEQIESSTAGLSNTVQRALVNLDEALHARLVAAGQTIEEATTWAPVVLPLADASNGANVRLKCASRFSTAGRGRSGSDRSAKSEASAESDSERFPLVGITHATLAEILRDELEKRSEGAVSIDHGTTVEGIEVGEAAGDDEDGEKEDEYPVTVTLKHADDGEQEMVHAQFVIGCDGADSLTRTQLGVDMEGEGAEHLFCTLDLSTIETDFPDAGCASTVHAANGGGSLQLLPQEDGKVRLYIDLSPADLDGKQTMTPARALDIARGILQPFTLDVDEKDVHACSTHHLTQRVAAAYSHGASQRVHLAGSAAHVLLPRVGEGIDLSLQDALFAVDGVCKVLQGDAKRADLAQYEHRQRPLATRALELDLDVDDFKL